MSTEISNELRNGRRYEFTHNGTMQYREGSMTDKQREIVEQSNIQDLIQIGDTDSANSYIFDRIDCSRLFSKLHCDQWKQ